MRTIEIVRKPTRAEMHDARMIWHQMGNKVALMEARGCSKQQCDRYVGRVLLQLESGRLDEGIFDMLGSFLTKFANSSLSQGVKSMIGDKVVSMIGLDRKSFLGGTISNFIENTTASDLISLFQGADKCKTVATRLASALQEQIVEQFITGPLGLEASSVVGKTIIEAIKAQFIEGGPIVKKIVEMVCGIKLSDLLPGVATSKSITDMGANLQAALSSVASTATQAVGALAGGAAAPTAAAVAPTV